ncbi:MAG TPA: hypothetical protein VK668_07755 [Mucilaginibacter sp.]|nr:hypothetical protein [Mucilaginibacter sp.]
MNNSDSLAFAALFKEAYLKCFGQAFENPISETESKLLCNQVLDQTGLSIGWKSVKNYSFFIVGNTTTKPENPSVATLDTLARYVLKAPYTTEIKRKNDESHHPYWFLYKEQFNKSVKKTPFKKLPSLAFIGAMIFVLITVSGIYFELTHAKKPAEFSDDFKSVSDTALTDRDWLLKNPDTAFWNKKGEQPGQLTLYTLKGDNWPDPANRPAVKNLLLRPIPYDCFTAEIHLNNFIPQQEWQQAGILLLEDTTLTGKSIRLSVAYNDFFGGYPKPKEILIQAITSLGNGFGKPEEIAHQPIIYIDSIKSNPALIKNLQNSALRIEKHGKKFRFLYAGGQSENGAFKEVVSQEFDMQPKYIGIFAIKGFVNGSAEIPARFTFFRITGEACGQ